MIIFLNENKTKEGSSSIVATIRRICEVNGVEIVTEYNSKVDLCISVGGDGTFIDTARKAELAPVIGVNTGTLGYLTEIKPDEVESALHSLFDKKYEVETRMKLSGFVIRNGKTIHIDNAINDICLAKNTALGILRLDLYVDEILLNHYDGDGIVICSPTGSTAYNLSLGGPIIEPGAAMITLTPHASHSMINRSIVLSDESFIKIKIGEIRQSSECYVLFDGKPFFAKTGDEIIVTKACLGFKIIRLKKESFLNNIKEKMR